MRAFRPTMPQTCAVGNICGLRARALTLPLLVSTPPFRPRHCAGARAAHCSENRRRARRGSRVARGIVRGLIADADVCFRPLATLTCSGICVTRAFNSDRIFGVPQSCRSIVYLTQASDTFQVE